MPGATRPELLEIRSLLFSNDPNFRTAIKLAKNVKSLTLGKDLDDLQLRSLAAEILDYGGRYDDAIAVLKTEGPRCLELIRDFIKKPDSAHPSKLKLLKQQTWITIQWGYTYYRSGNFPDAQRIFSICSSAALLLEKRGIPIDGTLAKIYYSLGLVYRELFQYKEAKLEFTLGIEHSWRHLEVNSKKNRSVSSTALTDFNIARSLGLGLAWVFLSEGNLEAATPLLLAARALLTRYRHDKLIKVYVDVVYAVVLRLRLGDEERYLNEAIVILKRSFKVFEAEGHGYYKVRTAHDLALALLQRGKNKNSQKIALTECLEYVKDLEKSQEPRFHWIAKTIRSRVALALKQHDTAYDLAVEALQLTPPNSIGRVDAHIARGQARLHLRNPDGACEDFEAALKGSDENPLLSASSHLHLVDANLSRNDISKAVLHWREWLKLKSHVENAYLRQKEKQVGRKLDSAEKNFVIRFDEETMDYKKLTDNLHRFLVEWARSRTSKEDEAQVKLRVSKQTYFTWKSKPRR